MASLYDAIRKPWAAWEMTMEGHDPTGVANGVQLLSDGDMEAAGTAAWTGVNATLSKETTNPYEGSQVLRISYPGINNGEARQNILTAGARYHVTGWARGDGTYIPQIRMQGKTPWAGTSSTNWQEIDIETTADGPLFRLYSTLSGSGYVEFDDVRVELMPPRVLDLSGNGRHLTLGDGAGGNEPTKLTDKRGYAGGTQQGSSYLLRDTDTSWTANRLTVQFDFASIDNSTAGYLFAMESVSAGFVFALSHQTGEYRFYSGSLGSPNNAARWSLGNHQIGAGQLVGRYDGTNTSLFFGGQKIADAVTPVAPQTGSDFNISVFCRRSVANFVTDMQAYTARLWDVALSDIEIQELNRRAKQELTRI